MDKYFIEMLDRELLENGEKNYLAEVTDEIRRT